MNRKKARSEDRTIISLPDTLQLLLIVDQPVAEAENKLSEMKRLKVDKSNQNEFQDSIENDTK